MDITLNICQFFQVFQGFVFGPLHFFIYISDLNTTNKQNKIHHFADDTTLLHINSSIKKLNKAINSDLRNLTNWFNANNISLNVSKTELILFESKIKNWFFISTSNLMAKNFAQLHQ